MNKESLKCAACEEIDRQRERILQIGNSILDNPELGFKETKTAALVEEQFRQMKLPCVTGLGLTGVRADASGKKGDIRVAVLGEMDAVVCPAHPNADPLSGAAHACGHNAQIASMLGAAIGLVESDVIRHLSGSVAFFALPAEEFVELEFRENLRRKGKIDFFSGKQELIHLGAFDDVDMAMMVHAKADGTETKAYVNSASSAFIAKTIRFRGVESHAGNAPDQGVNALNAAAAAIMCINAQRETFRDEEGIRVHLIMTKGGDLVNIVPADVRMEAYVRGKTMEAAYAANQKVNRALQGAAYATGVEVEINEMPGYLPLNANPRMTELFTQNIAALIGTENIETATTIGGSTDMGDISSLMPAIHPYIGGFSGKAHSCDFRVVDESVAYLLPGKAMAMTVIDLLWDGAAAAHGALNEWKAPYTKEEYLRLLKPNFMENK